VLRHEDLDGERATSDAAQRIEATLLWLGLDWDGEGTRQSADLEPYRRAMRQLEQANLIYPCSLSRREVREATSAPHLKAGGSGRFPPELRPKVSEGRFDREDSNYRLKIDPGLECVRDSISGEHKLDVSMDCGDFVVWTKAGVPAYQLAVVVDDAAQGVTDVVRGDDLIPSAARQLALARMLGLPSPNWWHLPLVFGSDGKRLAKRNGGGEVAAYRDRGVASERVLGLLAWWSGLQEERHSTSIEAIVERISEDALVRLVNRERPAGQKRCLSSEDHAWLCDDSS
jgi:glutamyl-tRNA synthetase